ncbi:intermembrane phospholipid transport protein YdbH family protein [Colwellia psychrerythraea]|uniref:Dicarboxylate transport n=1 Tax=Colwellia psychrerythraea TaxID=28229 RepID=A0A099KQ35_COLPS|nr:YdbH domain-containing protein [Colwellia psychrerythraea]KGJ91748.1 Dicarboxylate transport [Colwellia psychrerythraea]
MRFFKVTLAIFLVIVVALVSVFFARSSVVTSLVNDYLTQHNSTIRCIDFTVNAEFDLVITKLCIDSPYADIELVDSIIEWRFEPSNLAIDKIAEVISAIKITSAKVRVKTDVGLTSSPTQSHVPLNKLPSSIRQLMYGIAEFTLPIAINIDSFSYQPFFADSVNDTDKAKQSYQGKFSANTEKTFLSLFNATKAQVVSLDLTRTEADFTANLNADLAKLKQLLKLHHSILPPALSELLIHRKNTAWSVTGKFSSQIGWHKQVLSLKNKLSNFSFQTKQGFAQSGSIGVGATLAWQASLAGENLQIDFAKNSVIKLLFEQQKLTEFFSAQVNDKQLKQLVADNAMHKVAIKPLGLIKVDFKQQNITSDGVTLFSTNLTKPLILSFNNIAFNYTDESELTVNLQKAQFSLTGQAKIAQLQPYSTRPLKLNITGKITQQSDVWLVGLGQETFIEITQLSLPLTKSTDAKRKAAQQAPSIESLISRWQGNVFFAKNTEKSLDNSHAGLTFDLQVNNQVSHFNLAKTIHLNALELNSKLSGSLDNIVINTNVIAEQLPVVMAKVSGDIRQPKVELSANNLLITDLLALKVKPPVPLNLIDGKLNYHLSGHIKNSADLLANPMLLALSIEDVTGEVDGIWLQELHWQQKFIIENGQVKSLTADINGNAKVINNLTIAKIETAIPITQLSTNTLIDFSEGEISLVAKNTHGNLLDGRFDIVQVQWPFSKDSVMDVKLTEIDLEKLLELDKKQGIVVTGKVSGQFPIFYDGEKFLIKEGSLHNVGDGLIQVYNNPAVVELKSSSTELQLAFNALENLHYHHLTSAVSMADDGYMLLVTEIKGRNPDLDNEVNLNLNLSYDLLGLLESLNITEHFENKVIKGLQP